MSVIASASSTAYLVNKPVSSYHAELRSLNSSFLPTGWKSKVLIKKQNRSECNSVRPSVQAGFLDIFTKPFTDSSTKRSALKNQLLEAIEPLDRGCDASPDDRERIENIVTQLEAVTPIKNPLKSPAINGKWKLIYTTSDSILGTKRPKFLRPYGPIYQCIDTESLQALNLETTPFFNQVRSTLTPVSTKEVKVKFDYFKILGLIPVKAPESAKGDLETTYLDDEMRISRGNLGNVFVLLMDDPDYRIE